MRRYVTSLLIGCAATALAVAAFNLVVDVNGYWGIGLVAPDPLAGHVPTLDLMAKAPPPRLLVLGDSRAMGFQSADLSARVGGPVFNGWMAAASPIDEQRVWDQAKNRPGLQRLIYEVDYFDFERRLGDDTRWQAIGELFSIATTRLSIKRLEHVIRPPKASGAGAAPYRWAPDGHAVIQPKAWPYPNPYHSYPAPIEVQNSEQSLRYYNRSPVQPEKIAAFTRILREANDRGITPVVVLPPYLPEVAPYAVPGRARLDRILSRVHARFQIVDARDLSSFNGRTDQFVDGMHMGPLNFRRLSEYIFKRVPQLAR